MMDKPVITSAQLLLLAVGSALVFPYTFMPILNAPPANQDVWIVLIITFGYIFLLNAPALFLMNRFRGMNVNEMAEATLGKVFGKVVLIPLVLFFVYCYTACMLITAIFINLYVFPNTPTWMLLLFMVIPVSYAAYKGAGTIARLASFIVPFIMFTIIVFFLLGIGKMDFSTLKPVLTDSTFIELNQGAFFTAARYSEILIFAVFSYYLGQKVSINKTYAAALAVFGICFFLILIPTVTVLGVEYAKHTWNPYYTFTRQLEAFEFLERMQAFNIMAWYPGAILKLTIYNYMASYVFSGIVKAKTHKYFPFLFSGAAFIVCMLPVMDKSSTVEVLRSDQVFPFIILPIIFVIPLIMLIAYFIRRKKINAIIKQKRNTVE